MKLSALLLSFALTATLHTTGSATPAFLLDDIKPNPLQPGSQRSLQQENGPSGFFSNMILNITLPEFDENKAFVELIAVLRITDGVLQSFNLGYFHDIYGDLVDGSENFTINATAKPFTASVDDNDSARRIIEIDEEIGGEGTHIMHLFFTVENLICIDRETSRQAIPAGILGFATGASVRRAEIDIIMKQEGLGVLKIENPESLDYIELNELGVKSVFAQFDPSDVGADDDELTTQEVNFLFDTPFINGALPLCGEVPKPFPAIVVILSIPAVACVCLLGLAIAQYTLERRETRRSRERRRNDIMRFPGSPDMILTPGTRDQTTVRALSESADARELDEMVPITTIEINLEETESTR